MMFREDTSSNSAGPLAPIQQPSVLLQPPRAAQTQLALDLMKASEPSNGPGAGEVAASTEFEEASGSPLIAWLLAAGVGLTLVWTGFIVGLTLHFFHLL
jgi:hypothetical protein